MRSLLAHLQGALHRHARRLQTWILGGLLGGCTAPASPPPATPPAASPVVTGSADASGSAQAVVAAEPEVQLGEACGALDCRRFDDAAAAFRYVLGKAPLALGIGEAHARAGSEATTSTALRFSQQLLPVLAGRASHLVVELLQRNPDCPTAARPLEEAQKPVIAPQSRHNQSDYVELGHHAKALGIEPFLLTPTCDEFRAIENAGEDAIVRTLSSIASITSRMTRAALVQNRKRGSDQLVLAYGGAMHNDLAPQGPRASFCYGDELNNFTGGRYLALDLIVREFIGDNEVWRALPWYGQFDPETAPDSSVVLMTSPQSYVLFFPKTPAPVPGQ
jgi:hypothetical protein